MICKNLIYFDFKGHPEIEISEILIADLERQARHQAETRVHRQLTGLPALPLPGSVAISNRPPSSPK